MSAHITRALRHAIPAPRSSIRRTIYTLPEEQLTFSQKYGRPLSQFLAYSSLTLITLKYVWTRLEKAEHKLEAAERLGGLEDELAHWKSLLQEQQKAEAHNKPDRPEAGPGSWSLSSWIRWN